MQIRAFTLAANLVLVLASTDLAYATNRNAAIAAKDLCDIGLGGEASSSSSSSASRQDNEVDAHVRNLIQQRSSQLHGPSGILISDRAQDDGQFSTPINEGITRLFLREMVIRMTRDTVDKMKAIGGVWALAKKDQTETEQNESAKARAEETSNDRTSFGSSQFLTKYSVELDAFLKSLKDGEARVVGGLSMTKKEKRLKAYLNDQVNGALGKQTGAKSLIAKFAENVNQAVKTMMDGDPDAGVYGIRDRYLSGENKFPDYAAFEAGLQAKLDEFVQALKQEFPLVNEPTLQDTVAPHARDYVQYENDKVTLKVDGAVATYEKELGALVLTTPSRPEQKLKPLVNMIALHGAGTNRSNVGSWLTLFPKISQAGLDPYAIDMPGSTGTNGIGLNSVRHADEMSAYLGAVFNFVNRHAQDTSLPSVVVGRSMGSTNAAMSMALNSQKGTMPGTDMYFMMSFSNPQTLALQTENLRLQLQRGQIQGIVNSALDHADNMAEDLQARLRPVNAHELSRNEKEVQDLGVFVQGAADEDGNLPGKAPDSIIAELTEYRDTFFPFAHFYPFEAPQLKYGDAWFNQFGISPNDSEGTHFLLSTMANMSPNKRGRIPDSVPESDLPKLEDQQLEVYALIYGMLDYQIDQSPLTSLSRRESLRSKRTHATADDKSFAYLRRYVNEVINSRKDAVGIQKVMSLDEIAADESIRAGRDAGIYGRVKKVYEYVLAEKERIQALNRN